MRPKKRILLAGADELRLSVLTFALHTRGYSVLTANSAAQATALLPRGWDLVLCQWPMRDGVEILRRARAADRLLPTLVTTETMVAPEGVFATAILRRPTTEQLIDAMRPLLARKRGPRPAPRPAEAEDEMEQARRMA